MKLITSILKYIGLTFYLIIIIPFFISLLLVEYVLGIFLRLEDERHYTAAKQYSDSIREKYK
jgi:hypothetical protein